MDLLAATWQITHGTAVLLAFGELMASEPQLPWQASGETVPVARAAFAVQKTYANAVNAIAFSRVKMFDTGAAARDFLLAHNAALSGDVQDAVIESLDSAIYTLRGARLMPVNPRIEDGCRFACDYTLTGGRLDGGTDATDTLGDTAPLDIAEDGDTSAL